MASRTAIFVSGSIALVLFLSFYSGYACVFCLRRDAGSAGACALLSDHGDGVDSPGNESAPALREKVGEEEPTERMGRLARMPYGSGNRLASFGAALSTPLRLDPSADGSAGPIFRDAATVILRV